MTESVAQPSFRVLVQTVGTGADTNPVHEALAFTCRQERPDLLVQVCSRRTRDETVPRFDAAIGDDRPPRVEHEVLDDPSDLDGIVRRCGEIIARVRGERPDARFVADFTSGTKPMSAGLALAAADHDVPHVLYAVGPRDAGGRVIRTDRTVRVDTQRIRHERLLDRLGDLLDRGQYAAAETQAEEIAATTADPGHRLRAETLAWLAAGLGAWDRFDYKQAFERLRDRRRQEGAIECGWDDPGPRVLHLKRCRDARGRGERGRAPDDHLMVDLLANADRCLSAGRSDDALARLYRLVEFVAQVRLGDLATPRVPCTSRVPVEEVASAVPAASDWLRKRAGDRETAQLGLRDAWRLLRDAGDEVASDLDARDVYRTADDDRGHGGSLHALLMQRNESFLAHGTNPIVPERAVALRDLVRDIVAAHLDTRGRNFAELLELSAFPRCPKPATTR